MIKGRGQRVEVASWVGAGTLDLFERRVISRVAKNAFRRSLVTRICRIAFCQTKIEQDDLVPCGELQVLRLDIAVYDRDRLVMQEVERVQELIGPLQNTINLERRTAFEHVRKVLARNIFHDEKLHILFKKMVADTRKRSVFETVQK